MSIRMMTGVFDLELPPNLKIVALAVADNANDNGVAWPGVEEIARKSGYKRRQTITLLAKLVERGLLQPLETDELPEALRSRVAGVPVNRRPVVYQLRIPGVQSLHVTPVAAVQAEPAPDVQPAAPQPGPAAMQVETSRGAVQRHSGVQLVAHKTSLEPSQNQKTESSLRSDSAPGTPPVAGSQHRRVPRDLVDRLMLEHEDVQRETLAAQGFRESNDTPWLFFKGQGLSRVTRDLLWDAVLVSAGIASCEIPRGQGPSKARDSLNAAVGEIRRAGGSPRDVAVRAKRYVERRCRRAADGSGMRPTPHDLARRWLELGDATEDRFVRPDAASAAREQAARVVGGVR